jgi:hypothetical protein
VASIDQNGQLDAIGPPVLQQSVDRGPDRATRVEDVVDQDTRLALDREVERSATDDRLGVTGRAAVPYRDVVAVEGDVDRAERDVHSAALGNEGLQTPGEGDTARVDADESERAEIVVALDQLVRDS